MRLRFADEVPHGHAGPYVRYAREPAAEPRGRFLDLAAVLDARQDKWLAALDLWHAELSERAARLTPRWWWTAASRLTSWYPADFKPLFFALAVRAVAAERGEDLLVAGAPEEAREYLLEAQSAGESGVARAGRAAPPVQPWRLALSLAARILAGKARGGPGSARRGVLAFSYTLRGDIFARQDDHYFGDALDGLGAETRWLYYNDFLGERGLIERALRARGRAHAFFTDFLSLRDLPAIFGEAREVVARLAPLADDAPALEIDGLRSRAFARRFVRDLVLADPPYLETAVHRAAARALTDGGARTLVYPYEEKGIERALLDAAAAAEPRVRTVAFAHAVYNGGHLYLKRRERGAPPRPDAVAVTGPAARAWYENFSGRAADAVVGSPRHAAALPAPARRGPLKVLFTVGYGFELDRLAAWLEDEPELFAGCELLIRKYPYGWSTRQNAAAARLRAAAPDVRVEVGDLETQIAWCDAVLFASTSAGIHAMLRGRPGVQAALHEVFAADPVAGKLEAVPRCADAAALRAALAELRGLDDGRFAAACAAAHAEAARIYAPNDPAAWRRVLQGDPA